MKKIMITLVAVVVSTGLLSTAHASDWRAEFERALELGKAVVTVEGNDDREEGLAYTAPEEVVLEEAVFKAVQNGAPACECMKIAVEYEYDPYAVIKSIYSSGGDVKLDQLCMCATEAGIMKAVVARAAVDAVTPLNEPVFPRDEIAQSQCLGGEEALAYTALARPLTAIPIDDQVERNYGTTVIP